MILGYSGELKAYKFIEKHLKETSEGLSFWIETALGKCKMFLESKLLERPMIEFKKLDKSIKKGKFYGRDKN